MTTKVNWPIGQGNVLEFEVYSSNTNWNAVPGLYIFSYQSPRGWHALYVGQADNFADRLSGHERWAEAVRRGATHIHASIVHPKLTRDSWERSLIQTLQPPMNTQHRVTA